MSSFILPYPGYRLDIRLLWKLNLEHLIIYPIKNVFTSLQWNFEEEEEEEGEGGEGGGESSGAGQDQGKTGSSISTGSDNVFQDDANMDTTGPKTPDIV